MEKSNFEVIKADNGVSNTMLIYNAIGAYYIDDEDGKWKKFSDRAFAQSLSKMAEHHDEIYLRLNCPGGSIFHGNAMINAIKACKAKVHIFNDGLVASMAFPLFLSVPIEQRHASSNSIFMVHAGSDGAWGNCKALKAAVAKLEVFDNSMIKQIAADTEMSEEEVKTQFFNYEDHYKNADEMLSLGLISKIENYPLGKKPTIKKSKKAYEAAQLQLVAQHEAYNKQEDNARLAAYSNSITTTDNNSKMNKTELLAAVASGEISTEDLQAAMESTKTPEQKMAETISAAVTAAVKPLNEKIEGLEAKLNADPAVPPTQVPHNPTPEEGKDPVAEANKEMLENYTPGVNFSSES